MHPAPVISWLTLSGICECGAELCPHLLLLPDMEEMETEKRWPLPARSLPTHPKAGNKSCGKGARLLWFTYKFAACSTVSRMQMYLPQLIYYSLPSYQQIHFKKGQEWFMLALHRFLHAPLCFLEGHCSCKSTFFFRISGKTCA